MQLGFSEEERVAVPSEALLFDRCFASPFSGSTIYVRDGTRGRVGKNRKSEQKQTVRSQGSSADYFHFLYRSRKKWYVLGRSSQARFL